MSDTLLYANGIDMLTRRTALAPLLDLRHAQAGDRDKDEIVTPRFFYRPRIQERLASAQRQRPRPGEPAQAALLPAHRGRPAADPPPVSIPARRRACCRAHSFRHARRVSLLHRAAWPQPMTQAAAQLDRQATLLACATAPTRRPQLSAAPGFVRRRLAEAGAVAGAEEEGQHIAAAQQGAIICNDWRGRGSPPSPGKAATRPVGDL